MHAGNCIKAVPNEKVFCTKIELGERSYVADCVRLC